MHEDRSYIIREIRNSLYQIHKYLQDESELVSFKKQRRLTPYDHKKVPLLIMAIDQELEAFSELDENWFDPFVHEIESLFFGPKEQDIAFYERVSLVKEANPSLLLELGELMKLLIDQKTSKLSSQIQI